MATYAKSHVHRHGKGYRYKRRVPQDLQVALDKNFWVDHLGNVSEAVAVLAGKKLDDRHDDLITRLRGITLTDVERQLLVRVGVPAPAPVSFYAGGEPSEAMALARAAIAGEPVPVSTIGLASLIPVWTRRNKPRPDSIATTTMHVKRFVAFTGDRHPNAFTADHAGAWRDALEDDPKMGKRTVEKHLDSLNALFRAARSGRAVNSNPFDGIKTVRKGGKYHEETTKRGFTPSEARTIFAAAVGMPDDFLWMAKLCAATGARSGELAQLRTSDVCDVDGIPCLRLTDEDGTLKNRHSLRDVPIPPSCEGIIAYAAGKPAGWLFDYPAHGGRSRGKTYQHEASRFLRRVAKITDKAVTWHGWRHGFSTLCDTVEMPLAVKHALGGWKLEPGEAGKYGKGPAMAVRLEWLAKVDKLMKATTS